MQCPACKADNPTGKVPCPSCGSNGTMVIRDPDAVAPAVEKDRDTFKYDRATSKMDAVMPIGSTELAENAPTMTGTGPTAVSGPALEVTGRSNSRIGTYISKRYELLALLGKGGMGLVYKAKDHELEEEVAIKLLQPEYTTELSEIERLKREIVTARRVTHPNVIRIHEFGMDQESGDAYISMEVLPGGSLEEELRKGPIPINRCVNIAIGICEGLGSAHELGIIHRDLKPENVLFSADGRAKLVDFGLARSAGSKHTVWGVTGTPRYMSPEQSLGGEATPRTDVYSMGVVLFQMFTGQFPFDGRNIEELATKHAEDPPPKPRSIRKDIPSRIEAIILRALEKDAAKRWRNANEMAAELKLVKEGAKEASNPGSPRPVGPETPVNGATRATGSSNPSKDATLLIRADEVDKKSSDSTIIGPSAGILNDPPTHREDRVPRRDNNLASREPSNPGRTPSGEPRREPSLTGRAPSVEPRREPSSPGRVPAPPRREPSFSRSMDDGRDTVPPVVRVDPTTERKGRARGGQPNNMLVIYGGAIVLLLIVFVAGYILSPILLEKFVTGR